MMMFVSYLVRGLSLLLVAKSMDCAEKCIKSADTAIVVQVCPQTEMEWTVAAEKKNCKSYCSSFQYHCVMNTWRNETIEVCAPGLQIVGKKCAEFNFGGSRIQRNGNMNCSKCPTSYASINSFQYRECYNHKESVPQPILTPEDTTQSAPFVKSTQETTMNIFVSTYDKNESSFLHQSQHNTQRSIIEKEQFIIVIFVVVIAVVGLILTFTVTRKHWKNHMLLQMKRFCGGVKIQEINRESKEKRDVADNVNLLTDTSKAALTTHSEKVTEKQKENLMNSIV
uniref:Uncharacterized protein LOC111101202 n=1 Tax=Crassostrea virginica TaxID=6565 RepID=A0A8B8AFK0_CRAVI|nr:uncharacterized protein LOC111101202 [Crassostrea virginica]